MKAVGGNAAMPAVMPATNALRKPSTWALITGLLLAALLALALVTLMLQDRRRMVDEELRQTTLLARLLEEHVTRSIETAALALGTLAAQFAEGAAPETPGAATLRQVLVSLPQLRAIAALDAGGRVLASSEPGDIGRQIDLARLGPRPAAGHDAIGPALAGRDLTDIADITPGAPARAPAGVGFIPLLRSATTSAGEPILLVALLNPDSLTSALNLTLAELEGHAAVASYAGALLTGTSTLAPGADLRRLPIFASHLPRREHASYVGDGLGDGAQVVAFRVSRSRPLMVVIERPLAAVTAGLLRGERRLGAIGAGAVLAIIALAVVAARGLRGRGLARLRLDQAQRDAQQRLQEQLAFSALLLDISPLPTSMLDVAGRYLSVNRAWEEFTGRRRDQVIGKRAAATLPAFEAAQHDAVDAKLLASGRGVRYEAQHLDSAGRMRDLLVNKVVVPGRAGAPAGILCNFMDVTELRGAERATCEALDAAEEASRAKSEFIANMSHELRTPLQSIIGFSELGVVRGRAHEKLADMFGDIHASGQRMLALVNALLDVSKIESAVGTFHLERTDLRPLIREVMRELGPQLGQKGLRIEPTISAQPLVAKIDPERFLQVIRNVLANAIKFSPEGARIELVAEIDAAAQVHIAVRDHGPGIPEPELEQVFEAFVQSSRTKDGRGGTGLGLAICRKIVAAQGGCIVAENAAGGGSRFRVTLPTRGFADTLPVSMTETLAS